MISKAAIDCLLLVVMLGLTSSGRVMKRSDDADPYAAVISTQAQALADLQARLQSVENRLAQQASFRAVLNKPVTPNAPIHFDPEFTTGGGHYDPNTGVYTVAFSGVYLFGFQLFPTALVNSIIDLYVSGAIRIRSRCYDSAVYPTSCAASSLLHLRKGDTVWMQATESATYYPGVHSFFTAALLSPDP